MVKTNSLPLLFLNELKGFFPLKFISLMKSISAASFYNNQIIHFSHSSTQFSVQFCILIGIFTEKQFLQIYLLFVVLVVFNPSRVWIFELFNMQNSGDTQESLP